MSLHETMGNRRRGMGFTAQEFADLLRTHIPAITESRLSKIETGRLKATSEERDLICRLLECKSFEIQI